MNIYLTIFFTLPPEKKQKINEERKDIDLKN